MQPDSDREAEVREALRLEIPRLLRLAERLCGDRREAEDLAQETLFRAVRSDPALEDLARRRAWLARILVNLWRDRLRTRARRREAPPGSPVPEVPDRAAGPEAAAMEAEMSERIRDALEALPPLQKAAMLLTADEGMGAAEIAAALGSTPDRVKANLWQARRKMKEALRDLIGSGGGS